MFWNLENLAKEFFSNLQGIEQKLKVLTSKFQKCFTSMYPSATLSHVINLLETQKLIIPLKITGIYLMEDGTGLDKYFLKSVTCLYFVFIVLSQPPHSTKICQLL